MGSVVTQRKASRASTPKTRHLQLAMPFQNSGRMWGKCQRGRAMTLVFEERGLVGQGQGQARKARHGNPRRLPRPLLLCPCARPCQNPDSHPHPRRKTVRPIFRATSVKFISVEVWRTYSGSRCLSHTGRLFSVPTPRRASMSSAWHPVLHVSPPVNPSQRGPKHRRKVTCTGL